MIRALILLLLMACTGAPAAPPAHVPQVTARRLSAAGPLYRIDEVELARVLRAPSTAPRVYNFWATWCGPCRAEMPTLKAWAEAHPQAEMWFVDLDHPKMQEQAVRFIEEHRLGAFNHLAPADGVDDLTTQVPGWPGVVPVTIVVAPDGESVETVMGAVDNKILDGALARTR